jgi:c-di-GMP-binding flagellar brake protein YcgR
MVEEDAPLCLDKRSEAFIEIGTPLQLSIEGSDDVFKTIFVGAKPGDYIVTSPLSPNRPEIETLPEESKITARYIDQSNIFIFHTRFIKRISIPVPLLLWTFPASAKNSQQRAQKRINCLLAGQIECKTDGKGYNLTGVIQDISKSGCRFLLKASDTLKDHFCIGEEIIVRCNFPGIAGEQKSVGSILGISENDGEITVRIKFSNILWWVPPYGV